MASKMFIYENLLEKLVSIKFDSDRKLVIVEIEIE